MEAARCIWAHLGRTVAILAFPRTGGTFVYSLVNCDVEKPNFEWGKAAEQGLMEAARFS